jgi:glycosyltransferase involved in cell wall biosynthesis
LKTPVSLASAARQFLVGDKSDPMLQGLVAGARRPARTGAPGAPHILLLSNMYPGREEPGFGSFVRTQVESIRALGVHVTVEARTRRRHVNYVPFYLGGAWSLAAASFVLIHAHYGFHSALPALLLRGSRPLVVTFHRGDALDEPRRNRLYALLQRLCVHASTRLIAVSSQIKDALVRHCGADPARIDVISCGVDTERFRPASDRASVRAGLGLSAARPLIAWVSSPAAAERKGIDVLIGCARLCPQADFLVIGVGVRPNAPANCRFPGNIGNQAMAPWLQAADLFLLPSHSEGTPVTLLEAMACGAPGIASPAGGVVDVLENGVNGRLVHSFRASAFAAAIREVLELPADRRRAIECAARETVATRFDTRFVAERIAKLYKAVVEGDRRTREALS